MQIKIRQATTRSKFSQTQIKRIEELASNATINKVAEQFGMEEETFCETLRRQKPALRAYKKGKAVGALRSAEKLWKQMEAGDIEAAMFFLELHGLGSNEQNKTSSLSAATTDNKPLVIQDKNHMDIVKKQPDKGAVHLEPSKEVMDETFGNITKNEQEQISILKTVIGQVAQTYHTHDNNLQDAADNILSHIQNIKPQDHIEVMLVTQMIATHNAAMRNFNRAAVRSDSKDFKIQELGNNNFNLANKLTRTFATQMEALNRYRGKGQQKMTIEHVNISNGGQAVIGNLTSSKKAEA